MHLVSSSLNKVGTPYIVRHFKIVRLFRCMIKLSTADILTSVIHTAIFLIVNIASFVLNTWLNFTVSDPCLIPCIFSSLVFAEILIWFFKGF